MEQLGVTAARRARAGHDAIVNRFALRAVARDPGGERTGFVFFDLGRCLLYSCGAAQRPPGQSRVVVFVLALGLARALPQESVRAGRLGASVTDGRRWNGVNGVPSMASSAARAYLFCWGGAQAAPGLFSVLMVRLLLWVAGLALMGRLVCRAAPGPGRRDSPRRPCLGIQIAPIKEYQYRTSSREGCHIPGGAS